MTGPALASIAPLEIDIHPGEHPTWHFLGMTFNSDTIINTLIAGVVVLILGFIVRGQLTKRTEDHVPTKLQIIWEAIVGQVNKEVEDNLGRIHPYVAPLAIALFFFILIANWIEMIPSKINEHHGEVFVAPTSDTNLTYALAILAMVSVWIYGIRKQGFKAYFSHFLEPYPALAPLEILTELVKPVTLALRLFGNIFAGGIMLGLIAGLVAWKLGGVPVGGVLAIIANVLWKLFDMAIGVIQAFIFALLTVLYFAMAAAGHGGDEHDESAQKSTEKSPELAA